VKCLLPRQKGYKQAEKKEKIKGQTAFLVPWLHSGQSFPQTVCY